MLRWKSVVAALAGVLGLSSIASTASADYVCRVHRIPGAHDGRYGQDGFAQVQLYDGPNCTGSYIATRNLCTAGATSTSCSVYTYSFYNGASLNAVVISLVAAAQSGQRVTISGSGSQGEYVYFYGN